MNIYRVSIGFRHGYKSGQVASPGTGKLQILYLFIKKEAKRNVITTGQLVSQM